MKISITNLLMTTVISLSSFAQNSAYAQTAVQAEMARHRESVQRGGQATKGKSETPPKKVVRETSEVSCSEKLALLRDNIEMLGYTIGAAGTVTGLYFWGRGRILQMQSMARQLPEYKAALAEIDEALASKNPKSVAKNWTNYHTLAFDEAAARGKVGLPMAKSQKAILQLTKIEMEGVATGLKAIQAELSSVNGGAAAARSYRVGSMMASGGRVLAGVAAGLGTGILVMDLFASGSQPDQIHIANNPLSLLGMNEEEACQWIDKHPKTVGLAVSNFNEKKHPMWVALHNDAVDGIRSSEKLEKVLTEGESIPADVTQSNMNQRLLANPAQ